jgi:uncharacterized protein (TIGR02231 family)
MTWIKDLCAPFAAAVSGSSALVATVDGPTDRASHRSCGALIAETGRRLDQLELPRFAMDLERSAGHFAVRYPMESLGSVPPDGQLHALTLLRKSGRIQRLYRCVPLLDEHVYQVAEFENPLATALLAGPVRIYRGGDFVVTAGLRTTPPGKPLTVNLGVEPGISVARNLKFHESTEGLFGGDTALIHQVRIEVRSKLAEPVRLELFERTPHAQDQDEIKVEVLKSSPQAEPYDQTDRGRPIHGGWRFRLDLQPGQVVTCELEYRITIPSKLVLVGGNRRD